MSEQFNEVVVRRYLNEAYNKRNLAIGDELLDNDCAFHALPRTIKGIEE